MKSTWDVKSPDEGVVGRLQEELGIGHLLAAALASRGVDDPVKAREFLAPSLERDWHDPKLIPGLVETVDLIEAGVRRGASTLVFGDFDVDGITATAVMVLGLRAFGLEARPFIPRRQDEGYGLSIEAVDRIMGHAAPEEAVVPAPELVITVDCGITSAEEVAYLRELGVEVAVTDHHNPLDSVPQGVPVCNPRLDPECPSSQLAGVGVALKVIQELGSRFGKPDVWRGLIDLAALGTVADRMVLKGENRALVAEGVRLIREMPRPGIDASLRASGGSAAEATSTSLSFTLIPRMNAAGRMADALIAFDLLMCGDALEAEAIARTLEDVNAARREAEVVLSESAERQAASRYEGDHVLVLADRGWHEGVKGIVASRLASKFGVPTILFTIDGDLAHGSGRSVGKIDLFEALETVSDLTVKFGGHKYAAGVTVRADDIPTFRRRLQQYFASFPDEAFEPSVEVDALVGFEDLTMSQIESLSLLEPFGQDNPEPAFAICNAFISRAKAVGASKNHLSFSITNGVSNATAIYFHCAETEEYVRFSAPVDLVFSAQVETWRGNRQLKLRVKDMEPSTCDAGTPGREATEFLEALYRQAGPDMITQRVTVADYQEPAPPTREESAVWSICEPGECEPDECEAPDLIETLCAALEGREIRLHRAQRIALENLDAGVSTLLVMATGRGKSIVFYAHAARLAIAQGKQSIFIFPLRALVNDQAFHVGQSFARLGLTVQTLTGETPLEDREKIYASWESGEASVLLTTPEYLEFHQERLSATDKVGFIAVDEAHHIGNTRLDIRPTYSRLSFLQERFPQATVLAVSATAPAPIANRIIEALGIRKVVTDNTVRENLRLDDKRSIPDRDTHLATIVAAGEKTVVYVNSRQATIDIARALRKALPDLAMSIAFYNAGMSREVRVRIEDLFRSGEIKTIVATGAFGEGVNVPDIRHIVLYHMPFSPLAYNQMSGRCGRDGRPSTIHLLFSKEDKAINIELLERFSPPRERLVLVYKAIRQIGGNACAPVGEDELLELCRSQPEGRRMDIVALRVSLGIFLELGLLGFADGDASSGKVVLRPEAGKVEMSDSVRFCEGQVDMEAFVGFADWLMIEEPGGLLAGINRPLLPGL